MAVTKKYRLYSCKPDGTNQVDQIVNFNLAQGIQEMLESGDGSVDNQWVSIGQMRPVIGFSTTDVSTSVSAFGTSGTAISGGKFIFYQAQIGGTMKAGATDQEVLTVGTGICLPRTLTASQGQSVKFSLDAIATSSNGTDCPIAVAAGQLSAVGTSARVQAIYTLGAVSVAGAALNGVQNLTLDFGCRESVNNGDGQAYPTFAYLQRRAPRITFSTMDLSAYRTWNAGGSAGAAGAYANTVATTFTFLDCVKGAVRGSSPITGTINQGMVYFNTVAGDDELIGQCTIVPTWNGTNNIVAWS